MNKLNWWQKAILLAVTLGPLGFVGQYVASGAMQAHDNTNTIKVLQEDSIDHAAGIKSVGVCVNNLNKKVGEGFEKISGQIELLRELLNRIEKRQDKEKE